MVLELVVQPNLVNMRKIGNLIVSYAAAFMIGAYFTSQFKFDTPIEGYRWIGMSLIFIAFIILSFNKDRE